MLPDNIINMDPFAQQAYTFFNGNEMQSNTPREIDHKTMRDLALAAYKPVNKLKGFTLVPGLSSKETAVYVNPNTKQAVVSFRGSVTPDDWVTTDRAVALGKLRTTDRYRRSVSEYTSAREALKGYNVYTTGHSLGGNIAEVISDAHPATGTVVFNPGRGIDHVVGRARHHNSLAYINNMDYVSMYGQRNRTDIVYSDNMFKPVRAHTRAPYQYRNTGI